MEPDWVVLAFSWDDVVVCWQDQRLARVCHAAWCAEGTPYGFCIEQAAGDGEVCIRWFVNPDAARLLDRRGVDWRRFAVGAVPDPPRGCLAIGTPA